MECLKPVVVPSSFPDTSSSSTRKISSLSRNAALIAGNPGNAGGVVALAGEAVALKDYVEGNAETPPLEGHRCQSIQEMFSDLKINGVSATKLLGILAQTALIAKAYITHFHTLAGSSATGSNLFTGLLVPAAQLYLRVPVLMECYTKWQEAEGPDNRYNAFMNLLGASAACLLYIAQAAAYLTYFEIGAPAFLALGTLTYFAAIADIVKVDYNEQSPLEQQVKTPPVLVKV